MEDQGSTKVIPTNNVQSTIHPDYPTPTKLGYVERSVEDIVSCTIFPENTDLHELTNLEFIIHPATGHYVDLNSLQIELKIQLLDANGGRAQVNPNTAYFVDNILQTIFPVRKVFINNVAVESTYHGSHLSYLKQLIDTPNEITKNRGFCQGAFPIEKETLIREMTDPHMGRMRDRINFSKQETIHLKGPLNLDVSSLNKWLLDGCTTRVVLQPAKSAYVIKSVQPVATNYKYQITMARLYVDRIKPVTGAFLTTSKQLLTTNSEYIFRKNVVHTEQFAQGQSSIIINRPFLNKIPKILKKFMVCGVAENGSYGLNPFFYDAMNIINLKVMIDGVALLDSTLNCEQGLINAYVDSLKAHDAETHFIPQQVFDKGGMVLVVKTNPSSLDDIYVEKRGNLSIQIKVNHAIPLPRPQIVYIVGETTGIFEINADREVITNYSY